MLVIKEHQLVLAIVSKGNRIFLTYTFERHNIAYWEFNYT